MRHGLLSERILPTIWMFTTPEVPCAVVPRAKLILKTTFWLSGTSCDCTRRRKKTLIQIQILLQTFVDHISNACSWHNFEEIWKESLVETYKAFKLKSSPKGIKHSLVSIGSVGRLCLQSEKDGNVILYWQQRATITRKSALKYPTDTILHSIISLGKNRETTVILKALYLVRITCNG